MWILNNVTQIARESDFQIDAQLPRQIRMEEAAAKLDSSQYWMAVEVGNGDPSDCKTPETPNSSKGDDLSWGVEGLLSREPIPVPQSLRLPEENRPEFPSYCRWRQYDNSSSLDMQLTCLEKGPVHLW